jgi:hypothetical protein
VPTHQLFSGQVQVWFHHHCGAVFSRAVLADWLCAPSRLPLVVDEVAFSIDRLADRGGQVAINLPGVPAWTIAPRALCARRERVSAQSDHASVARSRAAG